MYVLKLVTRWQYYQFITQEIKFSNERYYYLYIGKKSYKMKTVGATEW